MTLSNFGFVGDFRSPECAELALNLIMDKQSEGCTYGEILDYPGFLGLFTDEFLANKTRDKLIIKLKNMVRDVRDHKGELSGRLLPLQTFFRDRKKKATPQHAEPRMVVCEDTIMRLRESIKQIEESLGLKP